VDLATNIANLKVEAESFPLPWLTSHFFDVSNGLDWIEVAMLAVANNPLLKASRLRAGEAAAQVYVAGLLPDPQLSAGLNQPTNGGPQQVEGFNLGLGHDIQALITPCAGLNAGKAPGDTSIWRCCGRNGKRSSRHVTKNATAGINDSWPRAT